MLACERPLLCRGAPHRTAFYAAVHADEFQPSQDLD